MVVLSSVFVSPPSRNPTTVEAGDGLRHLVALGEHFGQQQLRFNSYRAAADRGQLFERLQAGPQSLQRLAPVGGVWPLSRASSGFAFSPSDSVANGLARDNAARGTPRLRIHALEDFDRLDDLATTSFASPRAVRASSASGRSGQCFSVNSAAAFSCARRSAGPRRARGLVETQRGRTASAA